jgi:hypothetical protein
VTARSDILGKDGSSLPFPPDPIAAVTYFDPYLVCRRGDQG